MTNKKLYKFATMEALKESKADFEKMIDGLANQYAEKKVKIVTGEVTGQEKELLEAEVEMLIVQGRIAKTSMCAIINEIKGLEAELSEGAEENKAEDDAEELMKFIKGFLGL